MVDSLCRAQEPVSAGSDWLTVIGTRGRTISYPVSCELTSCLASLPQWFPFFSPPLSLLALSLSPCEGIALALGSHSCIHLLFSWACNMTMWWFWTVKSTCWSTAFVVTQVGFWVDSQVTGFSYCLQQWDCSCFQGTQSGKTSKRIWRLFN